MGPATPLQPWIETFQSRSRRDLQALWLRVWPDGRWGSALAHPWGPVHRPDWAARGLIIWPRGGQWCELRQRLDCPPPWCRPPLRARARLVLRWWADAAELWVNGERVSAGDLFDPFCRWPLPPDWWQGQGLELELRLRSPLHDDGALVLSRLELEPSRPDDPDGVLLAPALELLAQGDPLPQQALAGELERLGPPATAAVEPLQRLLAAHHQAAHHQAAHRQADGSVQVLGHAHLDLAWLWPVADTWRAAERTFASVLALMERFGQLHFGQSTPALYAWLEQHRPELFEQLRRRLREGRWEPLNGPWVESDCLLVSSASLLRQFQEGQHYSRATFPEWRHELAWLPDSFGFAAGLPALARSTGIRWFCTHKLAWNGEQPFPHRLFRWRSRCGAELLALMLPPIGTDADPVAIETYRQGWRHASGSGEALWLPGVGDHGGGPTAAMLEQLELWQGRPPAAPQVHGSVRSYLERFEPDAPRLPVWRDELYLELHRGCATSRPDQKRHNRSLERLLREADLAAVLAAERQPDDPGPEERRQAWRTLLFHQFHDILPGTSIPEVFEQAAPAWCQARRRARRLRDQALGRWLPPPAAIDGWWVVQLQPLPGVPRLLRLPSGAWSSGDRRLACQPSPVGGCWVQLPPLDGIAALPLQRQPQRSGSQAIQGRPGPSPLPVAHPVQVQSLGEQRWCLGNGQVAVELGAAGIEQLRDGRGTSLLAAPLELRRWRDRGEFWDAWDIAADYRDHPRPLTWEGPWELREAGPLCAQLRRRGRCGASPLRLDVRLQAATPWLELTLAIDWRQRHELLRLELPLAEPARRFAADTAGGVQERPARPLTARERSRWEVAAIGWGALLGDRSGLAVLLDGPQGLSAEPGRLGVSLLRAPTWPDPGADNGWQRLRLALLPCPDGWRAADLPAQAQRFREPLWCRPASPWGRPAAGGATALQAWPALGDGLQLLSLAPWEEGPGALLVVQNLTPARRRLQLPAPWRLECRCDGLGQPLPHPEPALLRPWELACWRLAR